MTRLLWVCLGGAAGTACRYLLSGWLIGTLGAAFPWGTITVNVLGAFLAGALSQAGGWLGPPGGELRVALTTGVLGGFTTYSAFNTETLALVQRGALSTAALYLSATVIGCLVAGIAGIALGRTLLSH